jgi:hypothetical protein
VEAQYDKIRHARVAEFNAVNAKKANAGDTVEQIKPGDPHDENEMSGLALRAKALELLKRAQAVDGLTPFLVVHSHREGTTNNLVWSNGLPDEDHLVKSLGLNFEPERGEGIEIEDDLDLEQLTGVALSTRLLECHSDETSGESPTPEVPRG